MNGFDIAVHAKSITKNSFGVLTQLSIFILIIIRLNPDLSSTGYLWYGAVVFSSVVMILGIYRNSKPIITPFAIWIALFFSFLCLSYFWSLTPEYALDALKTLFVITMVLWLLSCMIQNEKDLVQLLKIIMYAIVFNGVYILLNTDFSLIGKSQIGLDTLGLEWNSNTIGNMMSFATLIALTLIKNKPKHIRILYFAIIVFTVLITLFTGSRKSVFFVLFGYALFTVLASKNKRTIAFVKVVLILLLSYLAIMNIPQLYHFLGSRFEGLMAGLTGKGVVDASTHLRMSYINYGITWFGERPFGGYGINNYQTLLGSEIGRNTYAHNNYIELLVDVGVIGAAIYYSAYAYILKNIYKPALIHKEQIPVFIVVMTVTILVSQYGYVTYSDFLSNLILCIGFAIIKVKGTNEQWKTVRVK